jgi:hypothetical protein
MAGTEDYRNSLADALAARADWLDMSELPKLKEELRIYQSAFSSLYTIYLKKGIINEDPYKQEAKIGEIEVPETGSFTDANRLEQLSLRLSHFDNQLDFLVNFYQFSAEFLNLDRIKRILGLVRYIDWSHLTGDSEFPVTTAVAELTTQAKSGIDPIALSIIGEALTKLPKATAAVIGYLKVLSDYQREKFKLRLRDEVTKDMNPQEASSAANIKKKFAALFSGQRFYSDLAEELIKEDYSNNGPALREKILASLAVQAKTAKIAKAPVSYKTILMEGVQVLSASYSAFSEIGIKLDENETLLANRHRGFWEKIREVMHQMMNKEPEEVVFDIEFMDSTKGIPVKQKIQYRSFRADMDKKIRVLASIAVKSSAYTRMEAMSEEQIISLLEKNIREVQTLHRTLNSLDEYFKLEAPREERSKIKGVKPELATIKNNIVRANQLRHEYSAAKEEEEQMKRLGIKPAN